MLVVLTIVGFCGVILELFMSDILADIKYRKQMLCPVDLKVEAYSSLDCVLSFLGKYKEDANVEKMGSGTVNKDKGKLIFDADILGTTPTDTLISKYIVQKIISSLSACPLPAGFPRPQVARDAKWNIIPNAFKRDNLTIYYKFENLNNRIPLCKKFDTVSKGLVRKILSELAKSSGAKSSAITGVVKNNIENFISNNKIFTKWSTIQHVASNGGKLTFNIELLKERFIIEPYIIDAIMNKNKKFKINLLTASKEILDAISDVNGNLVIPNTRKASDKTYGPLIGQNGSLENYCSKEIQFFKLEVRVATDVGNSYSIHCFCSAEAPTPNQRLPFNIIKIEEF
jgi:hypothetical protein